MSVFVVRLSLPVSGMLAATALAALAWTLFAPDQARSGMGRASSRTNAVAGLSFAVADTSSDELIAAAAARDPFEIYDESPVTSAATASTPINEEQPLRVLGTVVDSTGGSFALCQLGETRPVVLRVGQRIGDYELLQVKQASAVFSTTDGARVERRIQKAGT